MVSLNRGEISTTSHAVLDESSRRKKARKIVSVLSARRDLGTCHVLDIGTGAGFIASELSHSCASIMSIDVVDERRINSGFTFALVRDGIFPLDDSSVDIAVSNHVIEHVEDQLQHVQEILRVLKPDGICYLATPNRWWLSDPHYRLPFISWLPRPVADWYARKFRDHRWDIFPISHRTVERLFDGAEVENALPILLDSEVSRTVDEAKRLLKLGRRIPRVFLDYSKFVSPTLIYLIKPSKQRLTSK